MNSKRTAAWSRPVSMLLGEPGMQRVRAAQSLLALAVFVVFAGVQQYEVARGLIDELQSNLLSCLNIVGSLVFFVVIRSGLNQRFTSDPSLTFGQCLFGITSITISYAITGPARGAVMGILLLILVFAMFALSPARIRVLASIAFGMLASTMLWRSQTLPERYPLAVEVTHLMFALIIVASIAVLSVRMGALRARLHRQKAELTHALEQNRRLAMLDELTGLVNRRHMAATLRSEHARQRRGGEPMSVALIDIDLFKRVNDRYGHTAGDMVLKTFAHLAVEELRACDSVARWGGEEFLVMMPGTGEADALIAIERLRLAFGSLPWPTLDDEMRVTFSAGLATYVHGESIDSLVERADQCMYAAKTAGRDRVRATHVEVDVASIATQESAQAG